MALKGDRLVLQDDIGNWINEASTRGKILWLNTGGSGVALDNQGTAASPIPVLTGTGSPSGKIPWGVQMGDAVSIDTSLYHINFHKDEQDIPCKVNVMRKGWVHTNNVSGTPTPGALAYVTTSGDVTPTVSSTGGVAATPPVGRFLTSKDENGYVKLEVNLPYLA